MLSFFLGAALLLGFAGLAKLIWPGSQDPEPMATKAKEIPAVRMAITQPAEVVVMPPSDLDACRNWFALRSHMEQKGIDQNAIDALGIGLARYLLLGVKAPEVATDEA